MSKINYMSDMATLKIKSIGGKLLIDLNNKGCGGASFEFRTSIGLKDDGAKVIYVSPDATIVMTERAYKNLPYGINLDYETDLLKEGFVVTVPNAQTCGCGNSITI